MVAQIGKVLLRARTERLLSLWRVNLGKPDFDLLLIVQNGEGVAIGNGND